MSLLGLVLALAIVALVVWLVLARLGDRAAGDLPIAGPPDAVSSLDHTRQQQTIAAMELIARLNDLRRAETGRYADRLGDLMAAGQRLDADGWGRLYVYRSSGRSYTLTSLGSDGAPGPPAPVPWSAPGVPYETDLVLTSGRFTQVPQG